MPVEKSDRRHRVSQQAVPQAIERLCEEARGRIGMFEIEAVGVELGEGAGGDDYAWGVLGLDDVEGQVQGFDEGLGN
jgi:hypothetical protein